MREERNEGMTEGEGEEEEQEGDRGQGSGHCFVVLASCRVPCVTAQSFIFHCCSPVCFANFLQGFAFVASNRPVGYSLSLLNSAGRVLAE